MEFKKYWSPTPAKGAENSGEIIVESAGYLPPKIRIENMLLAGQRLQAHRAEMYDFGPGKKVDESFIDVTRTPGFDMADATQMSLTANQRIEAAKEELKRAEEDAKKEAKIESTQTGLENSEKSS